MDEPNSQPTRCPCGFFGSPQTLGLCSKCFREREQNQSQAAADISRPLSSSSSTTASDQSRLSLTSGGDQSRTVSTSSSTNTLTVQITNSPPQHLRSDTIGPLHLRTDSAGTQCSSRTDSSPVDNNTPVSPLNSATDRRGQKRKHEDEATETASVDDLQASVKRDRSSTSKHCGLCKCRLELAVREIGRCKCGLVFCLLHRLPEQHGCSFDHKEDGRREARSKMVPARKHVGTTLKRLDSDS